MAGVKKGNVMYDSKNPLRCFFAFEGYNSQGMALDRVKRDFPGFDWVCAGRSEIDPYAVRAADALFPESAGKNFGDISRIDWTRVPDFDLFTYSFPCTNISAAGRQAGFEEGSGTSSSLLWECRKAIAAKRPRYLVMENVKALIGDKFRPLFVKWARELDGMGYTSSWKVLNAKDHGVPQNRERVFMVSVLGGGKFVFPEGFPLERRLLDVLEDGVDGKYYLPERVTRKFSPVNRDKTSGIGQASTRVPGGGDGHPGATLGVSVHPSSHAREFDGKIRTDVSPCLRATDYKAPHCLWEMYSDNGELRIRRLTPRECGRLMDVSDGDVDKMIAAGLSDTRLYKLFGNSIVVACLYHILRDMFTNDNAWERLLF